MGLGLYGDGSGISATRFLIGKGAKVLVTDLKTREQLQDQIKRLGKTADKIKFVLGEHRESDFADADLIIRNPGVPRKSKFLQIAREHNIPIETDISLFMQMVDINRIIGITGTRGKSTTTSLIYEIVKRQYPNAVLGGNITKSPLAQMSEIKKGGPVVLELSSWLLEDLEGHKLSPHVSVVTNIYPDHLNAYDGIDDYATAKENVWQWQTGNDYVILNRDNSYTKKMGARVPGRRFWFSLKPFKEENGCFVGGGNIIFRSAGKETKVASVHDIKVPGIHNRANVLAATCAAMAFGIKASHVKAGIKNFKGVADRLELLREIKGVKYYNDTTSTTPEATIAALDALSKPLPLDKGKAGKGSIVLIAGGADKGLDFVNVVKKIKQSCRALVLLNGTGTKRLLELVSDFKIPVTVVDSMTDGVGVARSFAKRGDVILLSPACASFGMFVNEFDRGGQFRKVVNSL